MGRTTGERVGAGLESIPHIAARIEDRVHDFRARRAAKRGQIPTIVPFAGYGGTDWVRVLCRVVMAKRDAATGDRSTRVRGWRSFVRVPVRAAKVEVSTGENSIELTADRGGVVDVDIPMTLAPGWQQIELRIDGGEPVRAPVFIVRPGTEFGIVSDVDDTVMVTALPRPFLAAWNTFVLDEHARRPVAGMSVLYDRLAREHPNAPVVYLSTGAWNVAPTLRRFMSRNLYPPGTLLLTDWGPTTDRWFRSGKEHKAGSLRRLAEEFPEIRWLLVGDDGQHDEQLYRDFAASHPENVSAVAIRRLSPSEAVFAGGRSKTETGDSPVPWLSASDGAGLSELLIETGHLRDDSR